MMKFLISAVIEDFLLLLKQQRDFFQLEKEKRLSLAQQAWGEGALSSYLSIVTEKAFIHDLAAALKALKGNPATDDRGMLEAFGAYFVEEFPAAFDQLDRTHADSSEDQQQRELKKLFPEETVFFRALRSVLLGHSPQEISEAIVDFLRFLHRSPRVIIQSPLPCDQETKREIRATFFKTHPKSFLTFSVNKQLIGGIRFFVDGQVDDLSWFSKIQTFGQLSTTK